MSRSRRRPYWSSAASVKKWKKTYHRSMRSRLRMQMHHDPENVPVIVNECAYSDMYDSPRDGSAQYAPKDERGFWKGEEWRLTRK